MKGGKTIEKARRTCARDQLGERRYPRLTEIFKVACLAIPMNRRQLTGPAPFDARRPAWSKSERSWRSRVVCA